MLLVWKKFVEQVDAPQLKSALSTREPKLNENWRIEYLLDNDVQLQRITLDLKPRLIGHLHRTLQNELIEIDSAVCMHRDIKGIGEPLRAHGQMVGRYRFASGGRLR